MKRRGEKRRECEEKEGKIEINANTKVNVWRDVVGEDWVLEWIEEGGKGVSVRGGGEKSDWILHQSCTFRDVFEGRLDEVEV